MIPSGSRLVAVSLLAGVLVPGAWGQTPPPSGPAPAAAAPHVETAAKAGLEGRDAALLLSGQQGGQIAMSVLVFPAGSAGPLARVPWVVDLPGPTLAVLAKDGALRLEFAVYAMRKNSQVVGSGVYAVKVTGVPATWERGGGLKLLGYVEASPEPSALRLLVREPDSGAFGLWERPVPARPRAMPRFSGPGEFGAGTNASAGQSPGTGGGGMGAQPPVLADAFAGMGSVAALLALVAPEPDGRWVVAGLGGATSDGREAPFSLAGAGAVPATRPVLRANTRVRIVLLGQGLWGQGAAGLELFARVRHYNGREESCPVRQMGRAPAPAGEMERLDADVTLPVELSPGEHTLIVSARPRGGVATITAVLPFRIAPSAAEGDALTWPAVPVDENGKLTTMPVVAAGEPPPEEEAPPEVRAAYRAEAARYAADPSPASLRTFAALERASLGGGTSSEMNRLARTEIVLARELAKKSPAALFGLCLAHLDLYREHSRDLAYLAIGHSRRIVEAMAETLAASGGAAEAERASDVLTAFAGDLLNVASFGTAERLFVRAATIDEHNVTALMGRAGVQERAADPLHAIKTLERVLALRPGHVEATLRLGVNEHHANHDRAARKTLSACTTPDKPEWVRAVAWQELATMLLEDGDLKAAIALLRTATAALPADRELAVLLAATLDRTGAHREALVLVNGLVERPPSDEPSARGLYGRWPHADLDATRARLDAERPAAFKALAAALTEDKP
jgi:thioredoxin-like negative regulator of GroEL